jgi:phospholipid transport system substrate-binding protein
MLIAAAAAAGLAPHASAAISPNEAEEFVTIVVGDIVSLIESGQPVTQQETRLRSLLMERAAIEQVSKFVLGAAWRDMSPAQQANFQEAFLAYVARLYVKLLARYDGQRIEVTGSKDFGSKGVLVYSVARGTDVEATSVEWRVSDRAGGVKLIDIIIEGVSMLQTQRQECAAMLEKRGGDVDRLIADLQTG